MLKLNNVYKIYENGTLAVRNASLEFPGYGLVAIIGSSGCGKSTLLNLLSNNDIPSKGELLYNDIPYNKVDKDILNKDFAIIYQDFKLIENLSVYQNIMLSHELSNKDIDKDFVLSVADKLGITEILDEKVYSLSGGQQQRVAIARALVRRPKVIFADEPTGNLDSENTNKVYEILKELSKEILVVIVSHDKSISQYADRMIEMQNGKVIGDYKGDFTKIIEREKVEREVLDTEIDYKSKKTKKEKTNKKKTSKIGSKSIFSYTKGKNKLRKNKGLSLNSTLGLTIAFNNKSIAKKVVLSLICAVMIGFILVSTSMIFSTYEQTFYKNLKNNKEPFIVLNTFQRGIDKQELTEYIKTKYNKKVYNYIGRVDSNGFLNNYINDYKPFNQEDIPPCYANINFTSVLFIDDPNELGIKMLKGTQPRKKDEIAISKTMFDKFMYIRNFKNNDGAILEFKNEKDLLGRYIEEFHITITGVFEDNNYLNNKNIEYSEYENIINNNLLYDIIIRPENCMEDVKYLRNSFNSQTPLTFDATTTKSEHFRGYVPTNDFTKNFYYKENEFQKQLNENEVIVDNNFISEMEKIGKEINVGDTIELYLVKTQWNHDTHTESVEKVVKTKQFKVVYISEKFFGFYIISNKDYLDFYDYSEYWLEDMFVNTNNIKSSFFKDLRNKYNMRYFMNNFETKFSYDQEYVDIFNDYVALPLFFISIFVLSVLLTIIMSDIVKYKRNNIILLKSLGTNKIEVLQLFSVSILLILFCQFIVGFTLGYLFLEGINYLFAKEICNYSVLTFKTFWLGWENILLTLLGIVLIAGITVWYTISKLNGKNLRKLFQKQRK